MAATTSSMEEEDAGDDDAAAAARKKLRLSKEQAAVLEDTFRGHNTLNPKQKVALAKQLNLKPRQVEVWFQNRRARTKLKQTEIDCEYLRRCCERLADENRRLHKEVNDLRALKLSPQLYMNMSPPTTLTMCPQCQRAPLSSPPPTSSASSCAATLPASAAVHRHQPPPPPGLIQWTAILQPQPHRPQL
nr:homeobox-leucine zipper protein HAT3-like [Ipomoea batatas]